MYIRMNICCEYIYDSTCIHLLRVHIHVPATDATVASIAPTRNRCSFTSVYSFLLANEHDHLYIHIPVEHVYIQSTCKWTWTSIHSYLLNISTFISIREWTCVLEYLMNIYLFICIYYSRQMLIHVYTFISTTTSSMFICTHDENENISTFISKYNISTRNRCSFTSEHSYGVATISRLLKIIGLVCRISSLL